MKRNKILLVIYTVTLSSHFFSQWSNVGIGGFTGDTTSYQDLKFHPITGEPHVIIRTVTGQARVWRYTGNQWLTYGANSFGLPDAKQCRLEVINDTLFSAITYAPNNSSRYITLNSLNATGWIGIPGNFGSDVRTFDLTEYQNKPMLAFADNGTNGVPQVITPNNSFSQPWANLPTTGLSDSARSIDLEVVNNEVYISYSRDTGNMRTIEVFKFDFQTSRWSRIGALDEIFVGGNIKKVDLAINPITNQPYIAFNTTPVTANDPTYCKYFDGNSWVDVGPSPVSLNVENPSLIFHPKTFEVYIAGEQTASAQRSILLRYATKGNTWRTVSESTMIGISAGYVSADFHPLTGEPYIAFQAGGNNQKTSVISFNCGSLQGDTITVGMNLSIDNINYENYQWFKDNEPLENTNDDTLMPSGQGDYHCVMIGINGCYTYSDTLTLSTTNVLNHNLQSRLNIYPNPSIDGVFRLKANDNIKNKQGQIYNSIGVEIKEIIINNGVIDLTAFNSGVYLLRVDNQVYKLIKN